MSTNAIPTVTNASIPKQPGPTGARAQDAGGPAGDSFQRSSHHAVSHHAASHYAPQDVSAAGTSVDSMPTGESDSSEQLHLHIDYGHGTGTFDDDDFTQDKYPENRKDDRGWVVIKMGQYKQAGTDVKTGANIMTLF